MKKAIKRHAKDETKFGFVDLPGGLVGFAQLQKLYFKEYETGDNKGQPYMRGEAVVVEITTGDKRNVGLTTKIGPIGICATGKGENAKTFEDNVAKVLNELRKLGADPDQLLAVADDLSLLENITADLVKEGVYTRFKTEKGKATKEYPTPRVFENWLGVVADYSPPDATEGAVEEEAAGEEKADVVEGAEETTEDPTPDEEQADDEEKDDLDEQAEKADAKDKKAQAVLKKTAVDLGIDADEVDGADDWAAVAQMIRDKRAEESPNEAAEEPDPDPVQKYEPTKGDAVKYRGPKDKKAVEFEVTAVYSKSKKVDLKDLDTKKRVEKGVAWDKLVVE